MVVVAPWVQAGNPRQEDPMGPGAGIGHGSTAAATSTPTHTLLQSYHSPNATLALLKATWAEDRLGCPHHCAQGSARFLPRARGGEAWVWFSPTKDASLSLSSSSCPSEHPGCLDLAFLSPLDFLSEIPEVSTPPVMQIGRAHV